MGRYNGTLHKLVDNACSANSKTTWNQVLHYLECHTVGNATATNPKFDSPLPPYTSPSVELELELFDQQGPKREDSPLKIAVKAAPAQIIAALCHLGPEAARMPDSRDRLPLHWACRRTSENLETEKVLAVLLRCHPNALLHRDDGGRTPIHWLFWYHASTRSAKIVEDFCQMLPLKLFDDIKQVQSPANERYPLPDIPVPSEKDEIPSSALIIHDSRHGALPLHYAVMQGASKQVLSVLLSEYPLSKALGDRRGRTALAWYLGAGHLIDNKKHICGESNDPNATPWWHMKLSYSVIQLLLSSKVARLCDDTGRYPLHWACHLYALSWYFGNQGCLTVKMIQLLEDHYIQALTVRDLRGKTPLHICFDVIAEQQELERKRSHSNHGLRDNLDLVRGGPVSFRPPLHLMELLVKSPEADGQEVVPFRYDSGRDERATSSAFCEDPSGALPLHSALRVATSPEIVKLLIQTHPTSLVHTTEERLQTPLICALSSSFTAPLQQVDTIELMMAAYVTSRHGTFMDGRLALKMEDAAGKYPIHYAAQNHASLEVLKLFVEKFPRSAMFQNSDGDLPVHCLLSQNHLFEPPDNGFVDGASLAQPLGFLSEKEVAWQLELRRVHQQKIRLLVEPLVSEEHLRIGSSAHGMTPLHIAVAFDAVTYHTLLRMLESCPEAARSLTNVKGYEFSCLDLHELHKNECSDSERWAGIQELLFSFHPTLETYRRREELLDACVKLIRNEAQGKGSYHLKHKMESDANSPIVEISETLSVIEVPQIDCAYRPKKLAKATISQPKNKLKSTQLAKHARSNEKSIYDDELDGRYVVSPENSEEEEDEESFSSSSEEEYSSGDSGTEEDSFDGTSLENVTDPSSFDGVNSGGAFQSSWDRGTTDRSSRERGTIADKSSQSLAIEGSIKAPKLPVLSDHFDKNIPMHSEEKKEESSKEISSNCAQSQNATLLSDVALRLWCFFVLFNDPKNPEDSYVKQVESVLDGLDFGVVQRLIDLPVPLYAQEYLEAGTTITGVTLRDVASPRPKAFIRSCHYFLGRYEFATDKDSLLLHRSSDDDTLLIRATEHILNTEEYCAPASLCPGVVEEAIWSRGEVIEEQKGYMASKFGHVSEQVYFKLTRSQVAYENEVLCRLDLGVPLVHSVGQAFPMCHVLPLVTHYNACGNEKRDRRYKMDVNDPRFDSLNVNFGETILLSGYPYALVFPYSGEGDLFDYFYGRGVGRHEEVPDIAKQVATSLQAIHAKGIVLGRLCLRTVERNSKAAEDFSPRSWTISDFSSASRIHAGTTYMGSVSNCGAAQFVTGLLPPEMFVMISENETSVYRTYWESVEREYKVKVDQSVVGPRLNRVTGRSVVPRCHFAPILGGSDTLPTLPYKLLPARESSDIWCFGQILFMLCSGGRPLFPCNAKSGHLLESETIVNWDRQAAANLIYEHIDDTLAQDILLSLLSPYADRVELKMEAILGHPFFSRSNTVQQVIDRRVQERSAHERWNHQVAKERSDESWLEERTVEVNCWNFETLSRFHFSVSETVRKMLGHKWADFAMPCSFIMLPYKLSAKNKKAKLAPTTKKDVERAERMGVILLALSKTCHFALQVKNAVEQAGCENWNASKLLESLDLPANDYELLKSDMMKLAAEHVEAFRDDPMIVARMLVARRVLDVKACFEDSKKGFLYLVDEYFGIPLAGTSVSPYPLEVTDGMIDNLLMKALPFMHISSLYVRGVSKSVSGVVRLIFEAAYPHIPPSWGVASSGLSHTLDDVLILKEVSILQETLASMDTSTTVDLAQDLLFLRGYMLKFDAEKSFAHMRRVTCAGTSLWTTSDGEAALRDSSESYGFKEAFEIQTALEASLKSQEEKIRGLHSELERLTFRNDFNLIDFDVPGELPQLNVETSQVTAPPATEVAQDGGRNL